MNMQLYQVYRKAAFFLVLYIITFQNSISAQITKEPLQPNESPERREFFETIKRACSENLDTESACSNAKKGMQLAIKLTRDPAIYRIERESKRGYILEDFSTWSINFLVKSCTPDEMKPLLEQLINAEEKSAKRNEPGLAFTYLGAASFYRNRARDQKHSEIYLEKALSVIPDVFYNDTFGFIPEKFATSLAPFVNDLEQQPAKAGFYKRVRNCYFQQKATHMYYTGNHYLKDVFGPPSQTGLRKYEVEHAVAAYTEAIETVPLWSKPYRGRARAYDLLGETEKANKDRAKAKSLEAKYK